MARVTRYEYWHENMEGRGWTRLYLVHKNSGEIAKFEGQNVPRFAEVAMKRSWDYGDWYVLMLDPFVVPYRIVPPEKGEWGDWFESWEEFADYFYISELTAKRFAASEFPALAERLNTIEEFEREHEE